MRVVHEFRVQAPGCHALRDALQQAMDIIRADRDRGHGQHGMAELILVLDLGDRDVELVADAGDQRLDDAPLLLQ